MAIAIWLFRIDDGDEDDEGGPPDTFFFFSFLSLCLLFGQVGGSYGATCLSGRAVAAGMVGALLTPGCPSPAFARFAALRQRVRDRERARSDSADGQIHVDSQGGRRATGRRSRLRRGARRHGVRRRWPLSGGASALQLIEEGAGPVRRAPAGP